MAAEASRWATSDPGFRSGLQNVGSAVFHAPETASNYIRGTADQIADHTSGCADHDVSSCGGLWLDIVLLGIPVGKGTKVAADVAKPAVGAGGSALARMFGLRGTANTGRTAAQTCLRSFTGTTLVLMADGSKKLIEDIEVGDRVVATDPETGERVTRNVTCVWVHDDSVLDLLVDGEVITTTDDHLFWSVTDQRFERAD